MVDGYEAGSARVALQCSGLGHVSRGYESFAREAFDHLASASDLWLVKGGGTTGGREIRLTNTKRDGYVARASSKAFKISPYLAEQATFFASLTRWLTRHPVDLLWISDWSVGKLLSWHRRRTGGRYRLLLTNGGPDPPPFDHVDLVHQISPALHELAIAAGEPPARQRMIPYPIVAPEPAPVDVPSLRSRLELPPDRPIVLSVAAVNSGHKRLDYVIAELGRLDDPPYLAMIGQQDGETPAIRRLAEQALGADGFTIRTVPAADVPGYYRAADAFVLGSFREGLPRALLEAMSYGLPCVTHDWATTRYALAEFGWYGDFAAQGALAELIPAALADRRAPERSRRARERFSWSSLTCSYLDLLAEAATVPLPAGARRR